MMKILGESEHWRRFPFVNTFGQRSLPFYTWLKWRRLNGGIKVAENNRSKNEEEVGKRRRGRGRGNTFQPCAQHIHLAIGRRLAAVD
jgi:hypothetical protein